eukprot:scaffold10220_cov272-Chaetoceros_neogracile.AAC.32
MYSSGFNEGNTNEDKPLVIFAGWLGCQIKSLDRYAALYNSLGFKIMRVIAKPATIVVASSENRYYTGLHGETMDQLAMNVIKNAASLTSSYIIFHVFSNGGCFLWESIRDILSEENLSAEAKILKTRLQAVVFDSSPAYYSENRELLKNALKYCSPSDSNIVHSYLQSRETSLGKEKCSQTRLQRARHYWDGMKNCSYPVHSLYICSKDDKLTPFEELYDLIQHRESQHNSYIVEHCIFEDSAHCQHILKYPLEYKECILAFVMQLKKKKDNNAVVRKNYELNPRPRL